MHPTPDNPFFYKPDLFSSRFNIVQKSLDWCAPASVGQETKGVDWEHNGSVKRDGSPFLLLIWCRWQSAVGTEAMGRWCCWQPRNSR